MKLNVSLKHHWAIWQTFQNFLCNFCDFLSFTPVICYGVVYLVACTPFNAITATLQFLKTSHLSPSTQEIHSTVKKCPKAHTSGQKRLLSAAFQTNVP